MKKRFFSVFCLLLTLLLTSCDLLGGSLSEYVTEYTQNAALEMIVIPTSFPRDASQTQCIDSDESILIYLRNPQSYQLGFDFFFTNPNIQAFYDAEYKNTDPIKFTSFTTDNTGFAMSFPEDFLEDIDSYANPDYDLSSKDVSGTLYAYEMGTKRPFGDLQLSLHANTPPVSMYSTMMQLDQDPENAQAHYILCFEIRHTAINNDFETIQINNDTWKIEYDASRDTIRNGIKLTPYSGNRGTLIANPMGSDNPDETAPATFPIEAGSDTFLPTDAGNYDVFYYVSNEVRSDSETLFKITITDSYGLSTETIKSNKAEKLAEPTFSITDTPVWTDYFPVYIAGLDNTLPVAIRPATQTTRGEAVNSAYIEYKIDIVDTGNNDIRTGMWQSAHRRSNIESFSPNQDGEFYKVTARTKGNGYLQSYETDIIFKVIRSNHFFVAHSFEGDDEDNNGTLSYPYYSFKKCMEEIVDYQSNLFDRTLADGFYIDVLEDYNVTGSDDVFNNSYLINNNIDGSTTFSGKLTIQGVDDKGNPLSGTSRRTIDAVKNGGLLSWDAVSNKSVNLSLKNLTFTNGCSNTSGQYAGLFFKTISVQGNPDNNNEKLHVTITNCDITHMTGPFGYGIYFYGGNSGLSDTSTSTVTITDCTISDNDKSGIDHSYQSQGISSYEKLILAGNTKIQNNSEGGVSESLGLIIKSKDVTISNNKGYGVSAGAWAKIDIEGATITNNTDDSNNPKNLYLVESTNNSGVVSRAKVTLTGSLSGSKIGVTTATAWDEGDALIPFATYSTKPATGVFFSDAGYPVTLGTSEASIGEAGSVSTDIYVNNTTGNDETGTGKKSKPYKTLAKAVEMVSEGGAIFLARDQTFCTGNMETITISKNLTIGTYGEGNPPALDSTRLKIESDAEVRINNIAFKMTAVDGTSSGAFIYNDNAKVTCFGCTFTGGKATVGDYAYGGAIYNEGILHLERCSFNRNEATSEYGSGGAICGLSGYAELINCTFEDNVSKLDGAIWMMDLVLKNCSFSGNKTSAGLLKAGSFIHSLTLQGTNTFQDSEIFEMSPLTELPSVTIGEEASLDGIDRIPLSWLQGQNTLDFEGKNVFADDYSKSKAAELFCIDDSMGGYTINSSGTIVKEGLSGTIEVNGLNAGLTVSCVPSSETFTFTIWKGNEAITNDKLDFADFEVWCGGEQLQKNTVWAVSEDGMSIIFNDQAYPEEYELIMFFMYKDAAYTATFYATLD